MVSVGADVTGGRRRRSRRDQLQQLRPLPRRAGLPTATTSWNTTSAGCVDGSSGLASAGPNWGPTSSASRLGHPRAGSRTNVVKLPPDAPVELVRAAWLRHSDRSRRSVQLLNVQPGSTVVVAGAGAVGLSAVMAAVVRDAASIIAVDLHESRRALATELGATHVVDPQAGSTGRPDPRDRCGGADYAIDTTAVTPVVEQLLCLPRMRGMLGLIGVPADPEAVFSVGLFQVPLLGLTIRGIVEGEPIRRRSFPYLLDLHRQGKFPFDKLITTMPWHRSTKRSRPSSVARSSRSC